MRSIMKIIHVRGICEIKYEMIQEEIRIEAVRIEYMVVILEICTVGIASNNLSVSSIVILSICFTRSFSDISRCTTSK